MRLAGPPGCWGNKPMRSTMQLFTRLLLGAVLLPVVCLVALLVSFLAACSDKGLLLRRWARRHKWAFNSQ